MLICFAGIDGSGKSEQARRTVEWLNGRGVRTQYVWNIFEPWLLGFPMKVARRLFLRGKDMFADYDGYREARDQAFQRSRLAPMFHWFFLGEYMLRFALKVRWPLFRGRSVVCDRYVFDAVISLAANLHYSHARTRSAIRSLLRVMPRPDLTVLCDLPEEVAFQRKNDIPSVSYLRARRGVYQSLAEEYRMKIVDGCMPVEDIQAVVRDAVGRVLSQSRGRGNS